MDVFFLPTRGDPFCIQVDYFDSILEIKEKIAKHRGIPVSDQTLVFNNQTLLDDLNSYLSGISDCSQIQLIISRKIKLHLKNPKSNSRVTMEFDSYDPVLRIKEKIHEKENRRIPFPISRIVVRANGTELQDDKCLHECQLFDNSEVEVTLKPSSMATNSGLQMGSTYLKNKKMKVIVMSMCGEKITVEVNALDPVKELRKDLDKVISQGFRFNLPEPYFFIHKQSVMEEEDSFRQNGVREGDTIEVFIGYITRGS